MSTRSDQEEGTLARAEDMLLEAEPGPLYPWVRRASYIEALLFIGLLVFWLVPGYPDATFAFGLAHGIGYLILLSLIWVAFLRRQVPLWLLAATATPLGPFGSVVGIVLWDRSRARAADTSRERRGGPRRGSTRPAP
ncbi:hypothetical protein HJD18_14645 [Thermoleophilia bacterium SCSIO 60948]|nr:hypothetical protein HJD18_14645 [Thermoleophilia bacterium SCSIO 60948]